MITLQCVRLARRVRRRLFGSKQPHWAKDLSRLLSLGKALNVVRYLPTVQALACYPSHFFKSLPVVLRQRGKRHYVTPLSFIMGAAGVQIVIYALAMNDGPVHVSTQTLVAFNVLAAICSPVLAVVLCAAALFASQAASLIPFGEAIGRASLAPLGAQIATDYRSYLNLDRHRFFWSMFYYSVYLFVVMGFMIYVGDALLAALVARPRLLPYLNSRVGLTLFAAVAFVAGQFAYMMIARPYAYALAHASHRRTHLMSRFLTAPPAPSDAREELSAALEHMGFTRNQGLSSWAESSHSSVTRGATSAFRSRVPRPARLFAALLLLGILIAYAIAVIGPLLLSCK